MGLFAKLFGKKDEKGPDRREEVLAAVREASSAPMHCGKCLERVLKCFEGRDDQELRVEAINMLFELERNDYAEAMAAGLANDPECHPAVLRGLLRHFIDSKQFGRIEAPLADFIRRNPSETDAASAYGRWLVVERRFEDARSIARDPLDVAPESTELFGVIGEASFRLGDMDDALAHLQPACEMYERAFRTNSIPPDDINTEQLEFARLYGLLEEAAKASLGDQWAEAFENITMQPNSFGIAREAERLAAERREYRPHCLSLMCLAEMQSLAEGKPAADGDELEANPRRLFLLGSKALREGRHDDAIRLYREHLELDLEAYGAYLGWAAADHLARAPRPAAKPQPAWSANEESALAAVVLDLDAMTDAEKSIARASLGPLRQWLPAAAAAGATLQVHPLDVRLGDLYPERVEMRLPQDGRPPQAAPAFAARKRGHVRIDELLSASAESDAFARVFGYLVFDLVDEDPAMKEVWRGIQKAVRARASSDPQASAAVEEFTASAAEAFSLARRFDDAGGTPFAKALAAEGAFEFLDKGPA